MSEYKRVREQALLTDEEIARAIHDAPATKLKLESILTDQDKAAIKDDMRLQLRAATQAQLDKVLKNNGIEIKSDDQSLPTTTLPRGYELTSPILRRVIQEDMLKPDKGGRVWKKVAPKEE